MSTSSGMAMHDSLKATSTQMASRKIARPRSWRSPNTSKESPSTSNRSEDGIEGASSLEPARKPKSLPNFGNTFKYYVDSSGLVKAFQSRSNEATNDERDVHRDFPGSSGRAILKIDTTVPQPLQRDYGQQVQEHLDLMTTTLDDRGRTMKLSSAKKYEPVSTPASVPLRSSSSPAIDLVDDIDYNGINQENRLVPDPKQQRHTGTQETYSRSRSGSILETPFVATEGSQVTPVPLSARTLNLDSKLQTSSKSLSKRRLSSKGSKNHQKKEGTSSPTSSNHLALGPTPLQFPEVRVEKRKSTIEDPIPSPMPQSIPMPPLSLHTYLQLELSSHRPSPLYIHHSTTSDLPYESSQVKIERLQNFLLLPIQLEQVLWFGALACLDAWLYSFTILPLRFLKALSILVHSWGRNFWGEVLLLAKFIYSGIGRVWRRRQWRDGPNRSLSNAPNRAGTHRQTTTSNGKLSTTSQVPSAEKQDLGPSHNHPNSNRKYSSRRSKQHRRSKSTPSALLQEHKADILNGFLILSSCTILMYFDASRMYHGIRGQAAIKLYVIYNVLEVCDRLFSALGQDVLECLLSKETLERKPDGRSKVLRPLWLFVLALFYNLVHATSLFYQVITLNVAVNSYSNALLTLLMSNQFVEIKSTVFKKFEKENLFQLTCADVVERFQLWLMLTIIASRNIIEIGGLSLAAEGSSGSSAVSGSSTAAPVRGSTILPKSFTMLPDWTEQVIGPFLLVLGSEMLVDWIKHAYITKFNNTKPAIYGRFLDVLAKDYYSNAFADQNLTRRLGLPVIPLASLFIRASVQTYNMFLAANMPLPLPSSSPANSLAVNASTPTNPATTAALQHIDYIVRRVLGRSAFSVTAAGARPWNWTADDAIATATAALFFCTLFLVLLAVKLVLGMCLLSFARRRYRGMKAREAADAQGAMDAGGDVHAADGKRIGGWGVVEVGEDKRRWIYRDDPEGARKLREREEEGRKARGGGFGAVRRYAMVGKRIW